MPLIIPTQVPTCTGATPCPANSSSPYFYCQAGAAVNGCRPAALGTFPAADCSSQCTTSVTTIALCPMTTPCPASSSTFFYCQSGMAINGCRASASGPFPTVDCSGQCTTLPLNLCATGSGTSCPKASGPYVYCMAGAAFNGCRAANSGSFPAADCSSQCLVA